MLLAGLFATWDRPEQMVPAILVLGLTCALQAGKLVIGKAPALTKLDLAICLLALALLVRALVSPVKYYAYADAMLILSSLGIWLLVRTSDWAHRRGLWFTIMGAFIVMNAGAAGYQMFYDMEWGFLRIRSDQVASTISGFYGHYNYFANCLAVTGGALSAFIVCRGQSILVRILAVGLVAGSFWLIFESGSRGGLIALSAASLLVIAITYILKIIGGHKRATMWGVLVCIIISVSSLAVTCVIYIKVAESRGYSGELFKGNKRVENVIMAVDQITDGSPLGAGAHSFEWKVREYWLEGMWGGTPNPNYVHNEYLQVMTDYGWLLGGLFLLLILVVFARSWGAAAENNCDDQAQVLNVAGFGGAIAFLIQCMVSFPAHILANLLLFVCVLVMALYRKRDQTSSTQTVCVRLSAVPFLVVAGAATWFGLLYNLKKLGDLYWVMSFRVLDAEHNREMMKKAADAYRSASDHYPQRMSYRLDLARSMARLHEFEMAEEIFEAVHSKSAREEHWIKSTYELANHYYIYGRYLWLQRQPQKALEKLIQSRALLVSSHDPNSKILLKRVRENIEFLENTGISVVPDEKIEAPSR